MKIRPYTTEDCAQIVRLFYDTVHTVCGGEYTPRELEAWAPMIPPIEAWDCSLRGHTTLVAEEVGVIAGFADMDAEGYLDRLYVHRDFLRRGVATALCEALEAQSKAVCFTTHASLTARVFFERRGYVVVCEQQVERYGVLLTNFVMEKSRG